MSELTAEEREALERGVERWNEGDFRQAAEEFEDAWFPSRGSTRVSLHGLYEVAVAWTLKDEGKSRGHREVAQVGIAELASGSPVIAGLDLARFAQELLAAFAAGAEPPRIHAVSERQASGAGHEAES